MDNHYYDEDGWHIYSLPANEGSEPPTNAVRIDLPDPEEHKKPKLVDGAWVMTPCYKNVTYWEQNGTKVTITDNVTLPPEGVIFVPPPDHRYKTHNGAAWVFDVAGERIRLFNAVVSYRLTRDAVPFEYPEGSGVLYAKSTAISDTIQMAILRETHDIDLIPTNGGQWDSWNGAESRPFTLGQLKELFLTGYEIGEHNYAVQETHRAVINALTTPESFENYDVTTGGWK